ncbi:MAG: phospholipid carrier-dependent glycosyltransferase [Chloroflexi bacterium]|nr:phospholipid carrier-dependent glycosyltransferase [Chloroflexota bacterium]
MQTSHHFRPSTWFLTLILLLALGGVLRLIDITDPPLDFHPTRQLRNTIVARGIYYSLLPNADQQTKDLAQVFRNTTAQYEPPIIESVVAFTYMLTGGESYAVPRMWETFFWLLAGVALFDLVRRAVSHWAALLGLAYYLVLPFSVQASRSFQPDPLMTSALVAGIYFLYRWSESCGAQELAPTPGNKLSYSREKTWKWAISAGLLLGFAVLVKAIIVFLVAGAAVAIVLFTLKSRFWKSTQVWTMFTLTVLPPFLFYVVIHPGNNTEYIVNWSVAMMKLLSSADFYSSWLAFISHLFGLAVIFLSLAGTLVSTPRLRWLLIGLWAGYIIYGLALPFQMYTHSYYHIQLIPIIALGLASAVDPLIERVSGQGWAWRVSAVGLIVAVIGYQSWVARSVLIAEDFRHEPAFWKQVGDVIPADADVIALTQDYGYRLMLFGWRKVSLWRLSTDLSEMRGGGQDVSDFSDLTTGKEYFLVTAFGQLDKQPGLKEILSQYPIAAEGDGYVLYDLRK